MSAGADFPQGAGRRAKRRGLLVAGVAQALLPVQATTHAAERSALAQAERIERLTRAARAEGTFSVYASMPSDDMAALAQAFEIRYGVKLRAWRSGSEQVTQRVVAETRAASQAFDLVESHAGTLEALRMAGALRPMQMPVPETMPTLVSPAHREWVGTRLSMLVCAYNTRLVAPQELATTWRDFSDSRWRQRITLESEEYEWFATLTRALGERQAGQLFAALSEHGVQVRKGHSLIANLVAAGELPVALNAYGYRIEQLRRAGAPVDVMPLAPQLAVSGAAGIARHARHPNAAALFLEFLLGEGQALLAARHHVPVTHASVDGMYDQRPLTIVDPMLGVGEAAQLWRARYAAFLRKAVARG